MSEEKLKEKSVEIESIRKKHMETGILEENDESYLVVNLDGIDSNTASILTVYYEDTKIKLDQGKELQISGNGGIFHGDLK